MLERAFHDVGHDLHVAVRVGREAPARRHEIFVDHTERSEAHLPGVVVVGERKRVVRVEPSVIEMTPVSRRTDGDHGAELTAGMHSRA